MSAKILIVDDHEIVREGVSTLLARLRPDWEVCGQAASGEEGVRAVQSLQPDVVVLDITMPGISGLEAAARISALRLPSRVLIFTMHDSVGLKDQVRKAGAQGYVVKSQAARDLVSAIDRLLGGGTFFDVKPGTEGEKESRKRHRFFFRISLEPAWA